MPPVIVYITGFRQHAGKTVTSLGISMLLAEIIDPSRIGYIKPVGQRSMRLPNGIHVDEDALVINGFSGIPDIKMDMISPVRLESGFTKTYLESDNPAIETKKLEDSIIRSIKSLENKDIIIAEGTGHPGVGAIVGLSNAQVAKLLGAQIIFLSGGGIGKALDMLEIDLSYFYHMGSRVRGIIFNRLIPEKIPSMRKYVTEKFLNSRFISLGSNLEILGFLPQVDDLSNPTMKSLQREFSSSIPIGDPEDRNWKSPCGRIKVVSFGETRLAKGKIAMPRNLVIVPSSYKTAMMTIVGENERFVQEGLPPISGIIVTDCGDVPLEPYLASTIEDAEIPSITICEDTAFAEEKLLSIFENTKLQVFDSVKAIEVKELFKEHFYLDKFIKSFGIKV